MCGLNADGDYAAAAKLAYAMLQKHALRLGGDLHPVKFLAGEVIGKALVGLKRYDAAEVVQRRLVADATRLSKLVERHGTDETLSSYTKPLSSYMSNLAATLIQQGGRLEEAARLANGAAAIVRASGHDANQTQSFFIHASVVVNVFSQMGDHAAGEQLCREILAGMSRVVGPEHLDTLVLTTSLGTLLRLQRKYAEAAQVERGLVGTLRRVLGDNHPRTVEAAANLRMSTRALASFVGPSTAIFDTLVPDGCSNPGCASEATTTCGGCSAAWYCTRACQKAHWREHRLSCTEPLSVQEKSPGRGAEGLSRESS